MLRVGYNTKANCLIRALGNATGHLIRKPMRRHANLEGGGPLEWHSEITGTFLPLMGKQH